ncbi:hypothetical protein CCP3SC15_2430001 [Gammaproteobacteria bacterium]
MATLAGGATLTTDAAALLTALFAGAPPEAAWLAVAEASTVSKALTGAQSVPLSPTNQVISTLATSGPASSTEPKPGTK